MVLSREARAILNEAIALSWVARVLSWEAKNVSSEVMTCFESEVISLSREAMAFF